MQVQHNKDTFGCVILVENCAVIFTVQPSPGLLCRSMTTFFPFLDPLYVLLSLAIALCAGFVKGVVGFAMPLVLISGLTTFVSPELALAGLILPTLVSNILQSLRQGLSEAWRSVQKFRVFLITGGVTLVLAAQFVQLIPDRTMQLTIGIPVYIAVAQTVIGG